MSNWLRRGLVFAAAMVVLRLVQGALIALWQTQSGLISIALMILFVIGVVGWGVLDGRADAIANPDPDRRSDLAMTWLLAGLAAGLVSGVVAWLISLFDKALYVGGLINELTTFAAFTALVVFLGAIAGVTGGRWVVDRNPPPVAHPSGEERVDTDVFAAVQADETPTDGLMIPQAEQQTSPVVTAQRAEETETAPTAWSEEPTEAVPTQGDEAQTAEQTKPGPTAGEDQPDSDDR